MKKYLVFFTCLFMFLSLHSKVDAATLNNYRWLSRVTPYTTDFSPGEVTTYNGDYFVFQGEDTPSYIYLTACATGPLDFSFNNTGTGTINNTIDSKSYGSCRTATGWNGVYYVYTFTVTKYDDAGSGQWGLYFNTTVRNTVSWQVYIEFLSFSYSDTLSYDNITVDQNNTIIDQNDTIIDQNDTIIDQNNETNDKLDDLNNNLTNDNVNGVEDSFSQFEDFLDDNSTITQLITLPVTLYSSILQGISDSCTPFNLGTLYGENLILPCINIGNYLGAPLWGMIDLIISGFAIYSISKKLIKVFNNFSSMKDGDVIDD